MQAWARMPAPVWLRSRVQVRLRLRVRVLMRLRTRMRAHVWCCANAAFFCRPVPCPTHVLSLLLHLGGTPLLVVLALVLPQAI